MPQAFGARNRQTANVIPWRHGRHPTQDASDDGATGRGAVVLWPNGRRHSGPAAYPPNPQNHAIDAIPDRRTALVVAIWLLVCAHVQTCSISVWLRWVTCAFNALKCSWLSPCTLPAEAPRIRWSLRKGKCKAKIAAARPQKRILVPYNER